MILRLVLIVSSVLVLAAASAEAQLVPYDDFSSKRLDSAAWRGSVLGNPLEVVRQVQRGALFMHLSDNPGESVAQSIEFQKPGADVNKLTTVQANVTVLSATGSWAGNVGIDGAWYCSGVCTPGPLPDAHLNSVFVQLFIGVAGGPRSSLHVEYSVRKYTGTSDEPIKAGVLARDVKLGVPHLLRVALDPQTHAVTFRFDDIEFTPDLPLELQWTGDVTGAPYKSLTMSGFTVVPSDPGSVTASIDRVLVNPEY